MERKRILCFGDSLTWGFDPVNKVRFGENIRWTGVLQTGLGDGCRVIEEGQNGRTIATDDPTEGEKNGLKYLEPCLESQKPLDLMIIMLGTNDMKLKFGYCAMDIAGEMQRFLEKVQSYNRFRFEDKMKVLLIAPPILGGTGFGSWLDVCFDFKRTPKISEELRDYYKMLAEMYGCSFLDASEIVSSSAADGTHLDADSQIRLGQAILKKIKDDGLC